MVNRDEILRELIVAALRSLDESTDINVKDILRYSDPFELTDDLQIPYMGKVKSMISDSGGAIKQFPFNRSNLTNIADEMGDLVLPFTGGQIAIGLISRSGITDGIPSGELIANLSGGPVTSYNGLPDVDQNGIVYYVGEAVEDPVFVPVIRVVNNSDQNGQYTIGSIPVTIVPGQTIVSNYSQVLDGLSLSFDLPTNQALNYKVTNEAGAIVYETNSQGAGSFNTLAINEYQNQIITLTTTSV